MLSYCVCVRVCVCMCVCVYACVLNGWSGLCITGTGSVTTPAKQVLESVFVAECMLSKLTIFLCR